MQNLDLLETVSNWTSRRFLMRSGFYAGRGPNSGDLNSDLLEMFYQGIKKDVGAEEASNFVRFVNNLEDLSASAFVVAFEHFAASGGKATKIEQQCGDGTRLDARGPALEAQAFGAVMSAFSGRHRSAEDLCREHDYIKHSFIRRHKDEIPPEERQEAGSFIFK